MRAIVKWAIENIPGVNVMIIGTLVSGLFCFFMMRREVFPEFELEIVLVSVPYPGASPSDSEKGVCQPVEEAVRSLDGVKRLVSIAREGGGYVLLELDSNIGNPQKVVTEVRSRVDRITNFPDLTENPQVEQVVFRKSAIRLAILGPDNDSPDAELRLREVAESVRDDLLDLDSITQASIGGAKPYQIDIEVSEDILRKHGLTLSTVANILRRENIEMPGGQMRADGQEILLRGKNRREIGEDIKRLPVITQPGGVVLNVEDIGEVKDQFDDSPIVNQVNGRPALVINVERTADEDLLVITEAVHAFVESGGALPAGYSMEVWGDTSVDVRDRMRLLRDNGLQGLCLVFLLLALFLEFRLAFWVSLGIPICVLGAGVVLYVTGQTLNMLSMFAFLMALGIVVDDAIVVGENIYSHRLMGKGFSQAAIDGTVEVLPSVATAIATTIVAFMPFFFVVGVMGKFFAVMPIAVIAMLCISLVEASTALPCHLAHGDEKKRSSSGQRLIARLLAPFAPIIRLTDRSSQLCGRAMDWFGDRIYLPTLRFLLSYPLLGVSIGLSLLLVTASALKAGWVPFDPFPKSDSNQILAQITFPDGTPVSVTDAATKRIEQGIRTAGEDVASRDREAATGQNQAAQSPVKLTFRQVGETTNQGAMGATGPGSGSHVGQVFVELEDATTRTVTSTELLSRWRQAVGEISGAERLIFDTIATGPGGRPIEFKLLAPAVDQEQLDRIVEQTKSRLGEISGVYDIRDDATPGKTEFQIRVKDRALSMGITDAELAETIRNAYYGAEVMRLQRGRHEVKLMVRYPKDERSSLVQFKEIRVRGSDGIERPITELAEIEVTRAYSEINRLNQQRSVTITADVDPTEANSTEVFEELQSRILPGLLAGTSVSVNWEGQAQQTMESVVSLFVGSAVALLVMYVILVLEFRSYTQPLLIMVIIPFGAIGAVWGHALMGLPLTLISFFGLVALTGIVVNDSIVLVDFINARIRDGMEHREALLEAGRRRLRPVFLTSVTTIGGIFPMLLEKSFQAQFLVPMAVSIAFGLMLSTLLVLFQVPVFFQIYLNIGGWFGFDPARADASHAVDSDRSSILPQPT